LDKAKAWFEEHTPVKEHTFAVLPFSVLEKIVDKPLRIRGVAMTAGMSRNFNIYTSEELEAFAGKLVGVPIYVEHVAVPNAVGKVTNTEWDGQALWYEAEIYESDFADKIRKGLVQHVSVGADYEAIDVVDGKVPHGLHNAELSLVAVPGIPETNIQILEKLRREQVDPLVAGEYYLGFYQDPSLFLPEHFRTVWLDQANGVLAVMAKTRVDPAQERCQSILFLRSKWQPNTVSDWLAIHPDYVSPVSASARQSTPTGIENMKPEELEKLVEEKVKAKLKEQMEVLKCPKCGQTFDYYQWQSNNWKCPNKDCGVEVVPPEPVLLQVRGQEQPKDVVARAKNHFKKTDAEWDALSEEEKQQLISQLPPVGTKRTAEYLTLKTDSQKYPVEVQQVVEAMIDEGKPAADIKKLLEAEWDTEYINKLPDEAFAYIESGGEKDEQGKTTPRSLRHLPFKNAQGNLDHDHVVAALQRLDQTEISAEAKAEAKKKLCAAAKELDIASDVCGLTDQSEALRKKLAEDD
jgi:hypothetical protein